MAPPAGVAPCGPVDATDGACYGGFARMVTAANAIKADPTFGEIIVLDAGDEFMGTIWDYVYKGSEAIPFQNLLGVQAMVRLLGPAELLCAAAVPVACGCCGCALSC